jgi:RNA polymerase sigma factor for flagellar operon FliA
MGAATHSANDSEVARGAPRRARESNMTTPLVAAPYNSETPIAAPIAPSSRKRSLTRSDYDRFLPLVRRIAMRLARRVPSHVSVNDLISSGWVGLAEAYSRADPGMPIEEFEAYSSHRVKGAMLDYLRSLDPTARQVRNTSRRVARAVAKLTKTLGQPPSEAEIAEAMSLSVEEYRDVLSSIARAGMARLEMVDIDQLDTPEESRSAPDEEASRHLLSEQVAGAIGGLPERLQKVLMLYYQENCTLKEIGAILGVSESRVSQLHTEAMHRLRAAVGQE